MHAKIGSLTPGGVLTLWGYSEPVLWALMCMPI
jgi:hypothetical protein